MTGPARFETTYRVRFDEAGPDGLLRTSGLLRYTQDLAARHSESLGYDRAWYAARGFTWLVRTAELDILGPIRYGVDVAGTTTVVGFRRVWSRRESTFTTADGLAAVVRIDWVLLDARGAPTRIPAEFERIFPSGAPTAPLQLGRVALAEPAAEPARRPIAVRPQELDPLDHVNNAVYADWLDEAVGSALGIVAATRAVPRRVRLEYALAAGPDDRLEARAWQDGDGISCRIVRLDDGTDVCRARLEPGAAPEAR